MYKENKRMLKVGNLIKNTPSWLHHKRRPRGLLKTFKTEISAKTAKDIQSLTVFAENSIPEVWRAS